MPVVFKAAFLTRGGGVFVVCHENDLAKIGILCVNVRHKAREKKKRVIRRFGVHAEYFDYVFLAFSKNRAANLITERENIPVVNTPAQLARIPVKLLKMLFVESKIRVLSCFLQ